MKIPDNAEFVWKALYPLIRNPYGVAGVLGNLYAESGLISNNLQNSFSKKLDMSDEAYTKAVDNGKYKDFATDGAGYGIAQWTYASRKQNLLAYASVRGDSIGDLFMQVGYLSLELMNYSYVLSELRSAMSVQSASDTFLYYYEKPASISNSLSSTSTRRAEYSMEFYNQFSGIKPDGRVEDLHVLKRGKSGDDVKAMQKKLMSIAGHLNYGADGKFGSETEALVKKFQQKYGLYADGKAGAVTLAVLDIVYDSINKHYTVTVSDLSYVQALELVSKYGDRAAVKG